MIRSVCSAFVNAPLFRKRSAEAKLLWYTLYLHPAQHMCGLFVLDVEHMALDTGLPIERTRAALDELVKHGLCQVDAAQDLVWLPEMTAQAAKVATGKWTGIAAVDKYVASLGRSTLCLRVCDTLSIPYRYPIDTLLLVTETVSVPVSEPESGTEVFAGGPSPTPPTETQIALLPDVPKPARKTRGRKPKAADGDEGKRAAGAAVWEAYAEAFGQRYGCEPQRNARVNGQIAQFLARVPLADAPEIARWYVRHSGAFYAASMHAVGLMLRDAEKLAAEWRRGEQVNAETARRNEQTEANPFAQELLRRQRERAQRGDVIDIAARSDDEDGT